MLSDPKFFEELVAFMNANKLDLPHAKAHPAFMCAYAKLWESLSSQAPDSSAKDKQLCEWFVHLLADAIWPCVNPKLIQCAKLLYQAWDNSRTQHQMDDDAEVSVTDISMLNSKLKTITQIWPKDDHRMKFLQLRASYSVSLIGMGVQVCEERDGEEWARNLKHQLLAMQTICSECQDDIAVIDVDEHDEMKWKIRWSDMLSKASAATKMEKYIPKTEDQWRQEQRLLGMKLAGYGKVALVEKIFSLSEKESKQELGGKNKQQLKAILSDLFMSKKREDDAQLAQGWQSFVLNLRKSFSNAEELDTSVLDSVLAEPEGMGSADNEKFTEKLIASNDAKWEPRLVAAALTGEIFKQALELQRGLDALTVDGKSKKVKLMTTPGADVSLLLVGSVLPVCRSRTASTSLAKVLHCREFYQVATTTFRGRIYDYYMIGGENDLELNGGSFIPAWAVSVLSKTADDGKPRSPSMLVSDRDFELTIGDLKVQYKTRSLVFDKSFQEPCNQDEEHGDEEPKTSSNKSWQEGLRRPRACAAYP